MPHRTDSGAGLKPSRSAGTRPAEQGTPSHISSRKAVNPGLHWQDETLTAQTTGKIQGRGRAKAVSGAGHRDHRLTEQRPLPPPPVSHARPGSGARPGITADSQHAGHATRRLRTPPTRWLGEAERRSAGRCPVTSASTPRAAGSPPHSAAPDRQPPPTYQGSATAMAWARGLAFEVKQGPAPRLPPEKPRRPPVSADLRASRSEQRPQPSSVPVLADLDGEGGFGGPRKHSSAARVKLPAWRDRPHIAKG